MEVYGSMEQVIKLKDTPLEDIEPMVQRLRKKHLEGKTLDLKYRQTQLKALLRLHEENEEEITKAFLYGCGGGEYHLAKFTEVWAIREYIVQHYKALSDISKTKSTEWLNLKQFASSAELVPVPKGVALMLSTWNWPNATGMKPLVRAIACGCPVLWKPTERNPYFSNLMRDLLPRYVDPDMVQIATGGVEVSQKLLSFKYGLCHFVGGTEIGKLVNVACAKTMTPCILECGGINATIMDNTTNVENFAKRIAHGAVMNCGQLCIRPQYVIALDPETEKTFTDALIAHLPACSQKYKLIDSRHFERCKKIVEKAIDEGAEIVNTGSFDTWNEETLAASLVVFKTDWKSFGENVLTNMEIFGPAMIISSAPSLEEAIQFVQQPVREDPLALMIGSCSKPTIDEIIRRIHAGAVVVNGCLSQHGRSMDTPQCAYGNSGMYSDAIENFLFYKPVIRHFSGLQFLWKIVYRINEDSLNEIRPHMTLKIPTGGWKWKAFGIVVLCAIATAAATQYRKA